MKVTTDQIAYARSVASKTMRLWPQSEREDGYADAMVGLLVAARNFRPGYGSRFTSFAFAGIRGAVLDGLEKRIGRVEHPLPLHLFDVGDPSDGYIEVELADRRRILVGAINGLSARSKLIVTLYFFEGMTLKAIGKVLGVSEGRMSQLVRKITAGGVFDGVRSAA